MSSDLLPVFGIERLKLGTDGKGVRTLIGTYGCPLRCKYCLNPESTRSDVKYKMYSLSELYNKVKIDSLYFRATNGGLTFGGGEPALHAEFISAFIDKYCKSWNTYMETSLNVPKENIMMLENCVDKFVIDIKDIDSAIYKAYSGIDNTIVLENLQYLVNRISPDRLIVRVPLIKGFNTNDNVEQSINYLQRIGIKNIDRFEYMI